MEVNVLHVCIESLGGAVSRVWALWHDLHDHELGGASVHPLQVLLLHALCVEHRVVVCATGAAARSERLVQVVGILHHSLGLDSRSHATNVASESLLVSNLLLFLLAVAGDFTSFVVLSNAVISVLYLTTHVVIDYLLRHEVCISHHVSFVVGVVVAGHIIPVMTCLCTMLFITPHVTKLVVVRSQLGGCNQVRRGRWVHVRAEVILYCNGHCANLGELVGHEFHGFHSLNGKLVDLLVLDGDDVCQRVARIHRQLAQAFVIFVEGETTSPSGRAGVIASLLGRLPAALRHYVLARRAAFDVIDACATLCLLSFSS